MSQPDPVMDIMQKFRGFMESRVLLTGAELDLFTLLEKTPLTAEEAAGKTGYHLRPLRVVLDALTAIGALVKKDDRYQTHEKLAPVLSTNHTGSLLPLSLHAATLWETWSKLTHIVRDTGTTENPPIFDRDPQKMKAFIGAMHAVGKSRADQFVQVVGAETARNLLDIGGATGTYTEAFLRANPDLKATLFDLPEVIEMAAERLNSTGLLDRIKLATGDYFQDPLPKGHDLALVSAIIHSLSLQQCIELYGKTNEALLPGGRIIVRDHVMSPDRTEPKSGALFAINMLVNTSGGGTYTYDEIKEGLEKAGFIGVRLMQKDEQMFGTVEAFKPEE